MIRQTTDTVQPHLCSPAHSSHQQLQQDRLCLRAADSIDNLAKMIWGRHHLPPATRAEGLEGVCEKLELLSDAVARLAAKWANDAQALIGTQAVGLSATTSASLEQTFEKLGATAQWAREKVSSETAASRQQIDELQRQLLGKDEHILCVCVRLRLWPCGAATTRRIPDLTTWHLFVVWATSVAAREHGLSGESRSTHTKA